MGQPDAGDVTSGPQHPGWLQLFGPHTYSWNKIQLPVSGLPASLVGLRLLHLTDFHFRSRWASAYDDLIQRVQSDPPDLIAITGDFVDNRWNHRPGLPQVLRLLEGLRSRFGVFGVIGNHDGALAPHIDGKGIRLIDRQRILVDLPGGQIELFGIPRLERHGMDLDLLPGLPPRQHGIPRIFLSHFSDYIRILGGSEPDIFLAGHTHGGQVCLPGGLPVLKHTSLKRRYCRGVHRFGNTWLVANRGIGYSSLPIRTFCGSEVIEISLRAGGRSGSVSR